jgi:hypothetical protein
VFAEHLEYGCAIKKQQQPGKCTIMAGFKLFYPFSLTKIPKKYQNLDNIATYMSIGSVSAANREKKKIQK